mmetsp:Transcript_11489/g.20344  ORF Transcript_11489/g.20344 Transcript_11489/m.20344 type:complete len:147 (-) Transcript_11489:776-1216(-)|eukprot:CAMPEP_0119112872 /NCGR_PEP_ID=MMETSP1180-20130426/42054_1 /TAXON_ID=3052 ORGANISM="Chlamydomonas cf sp, Strain CCMP681" /NCGR_SAMPLE_ID=MMETSP1180 /ASSEMBLY_ACC=CAM_ASM_000741 /LENGTH=146 /DNA_ID=CAMNT_0007100631 /DNA_START=98 /DNA_END=538 /DNA_ORIENTATION=+
MAGQYQSEAPVHHLAEYHQNKRTQYNSKVKDLLYGGDANPNGGTPPHHGKRSVAHAGDHSSAPFATSGNEAQAVQGGQMAHTYVSRKSQKEGADKVSTTEFDPQVYRQQIIDNAANLASQKTRNWGSAGLLGQQAAPNQEGDYGRN